MLRYRLIMTGILGGLTALSLTACGQKADLKPPAGEAPQAIPVGALRAPTTEELTTPDVQARPVRGDEILKRSQRREPDDFDLPPQG